MANICSNQFFFCCESSNSNKYIKIFEKLKDQLFDFYFEVIDYDDNFCSIEGDFESKWTFPSNIFENLDFKKEDKCYFRCLSEEYGCDYVAMNVFKDGEWLDEQCFDL